MDDFPASQAVVDIRCAVILPSYNSGSMLARTVHLLGGVWRDIVVVIDGSTDGSECGVEKIAGKRVRLLVRRRNGGKGQAVLDAMRLLHEEGFTHAIVMDADGQHPCDAVPPFVEAARRAPDAMILGVPVFGADAPRERVHGRRVGNFFAEVETLWGGVRDSLFGFRLYPIGPFLRAMEKTRYGRRYDFDTEIAVRMFWEGVRPINRPVKVYYPPHEEGGVTHFRYVRDNLLLAWTHVRLCFGLIPRIWRVARLSFQWRSIKDTCSMSHG
jgi:glycosyltransferase involved in cell wall biosynthesis